MFILDIFPVKSRISRLKQSIIWVYQQMIIIWKIFFRRSTPGKLKYPHFCDRIFGIDFSFIIQSLHRLLGQRLNLF
jgi:hypothetical protein